MNLSKQYHNQYWISVSCSTANKCFNYITFFSCFVLYLTVTDLHQQGADHCVDPAHVGDGGHLVATQYIGLQGLCADLQIHLTCVDKHTVLL